MTVPYPSYPLTLKELGFKHEDVPRMAEICIPRYPQAINLRPMSKEQCLNLFEPMWQEKIVYI